MKGFFETLLKTEIYPFLIELAPIGHMLLQAFLFCTGILIAGFAVFWLNEKIVAGIEMRPSKSMKRILKQMLTMFLKMPCVPDHAQKTLFVAAPLFAFVFAMFFFFFLPIDKKYFMHPDFSLLYLLFASSCCMYAVITGGWSSATRFSFFGAVRMIAQSLSCQSVLAVIVMTILMTAGASDLYSVIRAQRNIWFVLPHFPLFVLYLLSVALLLGQAPFQSAKSKRELAGGVYAEYGGGLYALFLICENILLLLFAALGSVLFFAGTMPLFGIEKIPPLAWLILKTFFLVFVLALMKYTLPSWRTDKVIVRCFKIYMPFALSWLSLTACVLYMIQWGG